MPKSPLTIRRRQCVTFTGVAAAARALGVSRSAVSNYVSGRCRSSLSEEKRRRIKIEDSTITIKD